MYLIPPNIGLRAALERVVSSPDFALGISKSSFFNYEFFDKEKGGYPNIETLHMFGPNRSRARKNKRREFRSYDGPIYDTQIYLFTEKDIPEARGDFMALFEGTNYQYSYLGGRDINWGKDFYRFVFTPDLQPEQVYGNRILTRKENMVPHVVKFTLLGVEMKKKWNLERLEWGDVGVLTDEILLLNPLGWPTERHPVLVDYVRNGKINLIYEG